MSVFILVIVLFMANGQVASMGVPTSDLDECNALATRMATNPEVKAAEDVDMQCLEVHKGKHA